MESINVNLDNLTYQEREQLFRLVTKGNKSKVWKPELRKEYFCLASDGAVLGPYLWDNGSIDNDMYSIGNCYKTEEDAEFAVERMKVQTELQRYAEEHNGEIDWFNKRQDKYCFLYNHLEEKIVVYSNRLLQGNVVYFSDMATVLEAIKAIGEDRIKKYLFNITD